MLWRFEAETHLPHPEAAMPHAAGRDARGAVRERRRDIGRRSSLNVRGVRNGIEAPCLAGALLFIALLGCTIALAQPRTMYKPEDIENARRNMERYDWARVIVNGWKRGVDFAMQQDRDFFENLIPDLTPGNPYGQTCPACVDTALRRGPANLTWRVTDPDHLTCTDCGTVFPNADYPSCWCCCSGLPSSASGCSPSTSVGGRIGKLSLPRRSPLCASM